MMIVLENYAVALIVALLIGVLTAYWAFRRVPDRPSAEEIPARTVETPPPAPPVVGPLPTPSVVLPQEAPGTDELMVTAITEGPPDDLQMLKGVGAKFAARLNESGVTRFEQLARLSPEDLTTLDQQMGPFKGRLVRDRLVEQAAFLARGDRTGFEANFGNLGSGA